MKVSERRRTFRYTVYTGEEMSVARGDTLILYTDRSIRQVAAAELTEILVGEVDDWEGDESLIIELHMTEVGVDTDAVVVRNVTSLTQ